MLKKIITAKHRGFCAGVDRAVEIVEKSLIKYGAPVYVRHEIVHNKFVVNNLKEKGVIIHKWSDEILDTLERAWMEVVEEESAKDADFKKAWNSLNSFRKRYETA